MRPCCITATSSQICAATRKSWVMNNSAMPSLVWISSSSSSTCACTETSSGRHRFVRHQHVGIERQRARNRDALALAAGELVRIARDRVRGQVDQFEQLARLRQRLRVRHAVIDRALGDGLADRDARIERTIGVLENDLDALAVRLQQPPRQIRDFAAGKANAAGGRIDQPHDAARHGGFAGAAFADDAERAALAQRQRDVLRGGYFAHGAEERALAIDLAELVGLQHDRF